MHVRPPNVRLALRASGKNVNFGKTIILLSTLSTTYNHLRFPIIAHFLIDSDLEHVLFNISSSSGAFY